MVKTSPNSPNFANLKTNVNTYKNIIRRNIVEAKKLYYKNTFDKFSNDLRKTWNTINETLNGNKNRKTLPDEFYLTNDSIIADNNIIADKFNKYFVSIGGCVENNQQNIQNDAVHTYLPDKPHCTLIFKLMTVKEITDIINKLNLSRSLAVGYMNCIIRLLNIFRK